MTMFSVGVVHFCQGNKFIKSVAEGINVKSLINSEIIYVG